MGNISILLADDSITIQKVVGIIFAGDGYTLTVVDNGSAAIQKAQEILPDVVLIDVLMPGMNGYEVCEKLRAIPALATKPILLLTGSFEAFDEAKAKSCGADDHITKPFESQQIIAKVQEMYALGQRRAAGDEPLAAPEPEISVPPLETEPASFIEPTAFESTSFTAPVAEPMGFEPTAFETTPAFEPSSQTAVSPDDPWGAFTPSAADEPTAPSAFAQPEPPPMEVELEQPDAFDLTPEAPQPLAVERPADSNIGASWVPVEEQTFEFQEETVVAPAAVCDEEPTAVVPEVPPPAMAAAPTAVETGAVTLSEEQLKQALMSASKETIERIVWEVVPDLAESLIKETIRRITEGK